MAITPDVGVHIAAFHVGSLVSGALQTSNDGVRFGVADNDVLGIRGTIASTGRKFRLGTFLNETSVQAALTLVLCDPHYQISWGFGGALTASGSERHPVPNLPL
jgi:hypothetical protein